MSRRLNRLGLLLVALLASEVWALGLGDIRLDSALNEPLVAEIELLSATPEELQNLDVSLASAATFERYGLHRPVFLQSLEFEIVRRGNAATVIRVTSPDPVTEPFVTFLVEATWPAGRLLREYTVLLDPPTFAPPPSAESTQAVDAPRQATPADRGRIERPSQPARPAPSRPAAAPDTPGAVATGGDYQVQRGDTLWRIAERVRPDERVSMNQTMLAIYEANPEAFAGNINVLRANSQLRIPTADEIFRISRGAALNEVRRQNQSWEPGASAQPTLTLVPPDNGQDAYQGGPSGEDAPADANRAALAERIEQLEATVADQESLLEVRDNELAQLRSELARLRAERAAQADAAPADQAPAGEPADAAADAAEPAVDEAPATDEIFVEEGTDDATADAQPAAADEDPATADAAAPAPRVNTQPRSEEPGLVDTIIGALTGIWGLIGLALLAVLGILVWFARRASGRDDTDSTGVWDALDADDEADSESVASTERLRALARDDDSSIVVVEGQEHGDTHADDTLESPSMSPGTGDSSGGMASPAAGADAPRESTEPVSLEDTFSSETAINLDQSDPVAEADFHMAYGLYDQAADLINGALAVEPNRTDLMAKLCEIYFVWGNRDAFVDAAQRLHDATGGDGGGDWDKIVIMGQQIASDHELFSGASAAGATREVDLDFESGSDDSAALDMDFDTGGGGPDGSASDVIDLGADEGGDSDDDNLDFSFDDDDDTGASITREMPGRDADGDSTVESPTIESEAARGYEDADATAETHALQSGSYDFGDDLDETSESPTIDKPLDSPDSTSELPAFDEGRYAGQDTTVAGLDEGRGDDATAEIDLDDLGLDLDGLSGDYGDDRDLVDDDDTTGTNLAPDSRDDLAETGRNPQVDDETHSSEGDLLASTGQTQVLSDDFSVDSTGADFGDDEETLLARPPDSRDDPDFDFAKTEALPKDAYDSSLEETAESSSLAGSTDLDLDLDELTAALQRSESGDTVDQYRDDETLEQPRVGTGDNEPSLDFDLGMDSDSDDPTQALGQDDVSEDLKEARTMTEVGTKLDLARAYVDMGDPGGARSILEEVLQEGDESQRQQAQKLLDTLPD